MSLRKGNSPMQASHLAAWIKLSGVPSLGLTKMMSLGSRRGVSIDRKITGPSRMSGKACTVPCSKKSNCPGAKLDLGFRILHPESPPDPRKRKDIHRRWRGNEAAWVCRPERRAHSRHLDCEVMID